MLNIKNKTPFVEKFNKYPDIAKLFTNGTLTRKLVSKLQLKETVLINIVPPTYDYLVNHNGDTTKLITMITADVTEINTNQLNGKLVVTAEGVNLDPDSEVWVLTKQEKTVLLG